MPARVLTAPGSSPQARCDHGNVCSVKRPCIDHLDRAAQARLAHLVPIRRPRQTEVLEDRSDSRDANAKVRLVAPESERARRGARHLPARSVPLRRRVLFREEDDASLAEALCARLWVWTQHLKARVAAHRRFDKALTEFAASATELAHIGEAARWPGEAENKGASAESVALRVRQLLSGPSAPSAAEGGPGARGDQRLAKALVSPALHLLWPGKLDAHAVFVRLSELAPASSADPVALFSDRVLAATLYAKLNWPSASASIQKHRSRNKDADRGLRDAFSEARQRFAAEFRVERAGRVLRATITYYRADSATIHLLREHFVLEIDWDSDTPCLVDGLPDALLEAAGFHADSDRVLWLEGLVLEALADAELARRESDGDMPT